MAVLSDSEMLELVQEAIIKCLKKQSYRIGEIEYTYADLGKLQDMERDYKERVAKAAAPRRRLGAF